MEQLPLPAIKDIVFLIIYATIFIWLLKKLIEDLRWSI